MPNDQFGDLESLLEMVLPVVTPPALIVVRKTTTTYSTGVFHLESFDDDDAAADLAPSSHDFECPCGADVHLWCDQAQGNDDDAGFATVFAKRMCLSRNAAQLSPQCRAHLADAPTVVEFCQADIDAYCESTSPGENRIHRCLEAHATLVSPRCSEYMAMTPPLDQSLVVKEDVVPSVWSTMDKLVESVFTGLFFGDDGDEGHTPLVQNSLVPPGDVAAADDDDNLLEDHSTHTVKEKYPDAVQNKPDRVATTFYRVTLALLLVASMMTLVAACTLVRYLVRKSQEAQDRRDFQMKYAPLLVDA